MNKAVLFSIKPKHCENIIIGIKKVEVRKKIPKISVPFPAYIYETKGRKIITPAGGVLHEGRGKVIGEFVCDEIGTYYACFPHDETESHYSLLLQRYGCLTAKEVQNYGKDKPLYGLHISDLVIYEEPKDLSEFEKSWCDINGNWHDIRPCENGKHCEHDVFDYSENTSACSIDFSGEHCPYTKLTRPPQSWCYVEKLRGVG